MEIFSVLVCSFFFSVLCSGLLIRFASSLGLIDLPNQRSSHQVATPRGGGLALALAFFLGLPLLYFWNFLSSDLLFAILGGGGALVVLGFFDDRGHLSALLRLLIHFLAAGWALVWLGGSAVFAWWALPSWLGWPLALLGLVWLLNLYNFMDGIDGLAGLEAVSVGLAGGLLWWLAAPAAGTWLLPVLLAAAVAGFLAWNLPPARIFMGDSGSAFCGLVFGIFALAAGQEQPGLFWAWLILLGVFVVDASLTLLRRLLRGENPAQAHRSHAYQRAVRHFGRHGPVSFGVTAINLCWLLPLAWLLVAGQISAPAALALAYLPLVGLALAFGSGEKE